MSLIIYIAEKLSRTAHADVFILEHHQKVCLSTICREKHVSKILPCAEQKKPNSTKKRAKGFLSFPGIMRLLILGPFYYYYLFTYLKDSCLEAEWKMVGLKYPTEHTGNISYLFPIHTSSVVSILCSKHRNSNFYVGLLLFQKR